MRSNTEREATRVRLEQSFGEPITLDGLTPSFSIFQRARGHRHSIDDVLTAWFALRHMREPATYLDLGTGIGTVGLLALSQMPPTTRYECVEAQDVSYRLLVENLWSCGVEGRTTAHHADLRRFESPAIFDLITGSPPYFPVGTGVIPQDSQKAHARFELRGDVADYCAAASRLLAPGGTFVFCFPTPQLARAAKAMADVSFVCTSRCDVVPRASEPALFSLFACKLHSSEPAYQAVEKLVVRNADGRRTKAMMSARSTFGWPLEDQEFGAGERK